MIGPYFFHGCILVFLSTILYSIKMPEFMVMGKVDELKQIENDKKMTAIITKCAKF